jgi:hypothetical protein
VQEREAAGKLKEERHERQEEQDRTRGSEKQRGKRGGDNREGLYNNLHR